MKKIALLIIMSCSIISCTNPNSNTVIVNKDSTVIISKDSQTINASIQNEEFKKLVLALKSGDEQLFGHFIDKSVIVIYSNGAMPSVKKAMSMNEIENLKTTTKVLSESYVAEDLPKIDCSGSLPSGYTKDGCFGNTAIPLKLDILKYCENASEELKKEFTTAYSVINYTVIDTKGVTYYFTHQNNKWILVLIDTRIPCNA